MFQNLVVREGILAQFNVLEASHIQHGFSTLAAGNMSYNWGEKAEVERNTDKFYRLAGLSRKNRVHILPQHSNCVAVAETEEAGKILECDGLITSVPGLTLSLYLADCFPIIITNKESAVETERPNFVSLIHAGWRGTDQQIVKQAIELIDDHLMVGPSQVLVAIGPGIQGCCYNERKIAIPLLRKSSWRPFIWAKGFQFYIDLLGYNIKQLQESGVPEENIIAADACTSCARDTQNFLQDYLFFSHHRAKQRTQEKEGRFAAAVALKAGR